MMDSQLATVYQAYDAVSRVLAAHGAQAAKAAQDRQLAHQQLEQQIATRKATDSASHEAAMKDVAAQQDAFEVEKGRMSKIFEQQQEKVKLDVGGLFTGDDAIEMDEDDGSYFIDRDGRHFHFILDYLRAPDEFQLPTDPVVMKELAKEIEYYQVPIGGPTAAEKAAMEKAAAEAAAAEAAAAAQRAAAAERQRQELEAQQEQQRQQLAAQQQAKEQSRLAEAQRIRQAEEEQRAQAAAAAAASAAYKAPAPAAAPASAAGPASTPAPSAAAFFNAAAAPAPTASVVPHAVPAPFVPTPAPAMFNPAAAQAPAPAPMQTQTFVPTPVLATIPSAMPAPPTGLPPATDPRDMLQPPPPSMGTATMVPPSQQNPPQMQAPSAGAQFVPSAAAAAAVPVAAANAADPTGMTFGSKQLDDMSIKPLSQADHNTRRGWNDVPTNLTPKKKIVPVQAPIMSPMFQPGAAASGSLGGPPPAFNPGAFEPGPPPSGGTFQPGQPPTSQPAAAAPAAASAPAPVALAPAAPAQAQLSPTAKMLSDKFAKVINACRSGRTNLTSKVDGAVKRLEPYYAAISCDGSYDQRVQSEMNQLAELLLAGQARPALTKVGSLIQAGDGSGTFGQGLLAVKNLAGVVDRFIKANNSWPNLA